MVAVEIKRTERWDRAWDKPLRPLSERAGVRVKRLVGVYSGSRICEFDNVKVLPAGEYVKTLFAGEIF